MRFFEDIDTYSNYIQVSSSLTFLRISPFEDLVINKYLNVVFGSALIEEISEYGSQPNNSAKYKAYENLARSIAHLMLLEYIPTGELVIGDGGFTRTDNENQKTAFEKQINRLKENLFENGFVYLDAACSVIIEDEGDFLAFNNSPLKLEHDLLVIKSAKDFNAIYRLYLPTITFRFLIPTMQNVFEMYIENSFSFVLNFIHNNPLNESQEKFQKAIKYAIAYYTLYHAILENIAQISPKGITIFQQDLENHSETRKSIGNSSITGQIEMFKRNASIRVDQALQIVNSNPVDFGITPRANYVQKSEWI